MNNFILQCAIFHVGQMVKGGYAVVKFIGEGAVEIAHASWVYSKDGVSK